MVMEDDSHAVCTGPDRLCREGSISSISALACFSVPSLYPCTSLEKYTLQHCSVLYVHLKLPDVVEAAPLADEAGVNLQLLLVGMEVMVAIPQVLGAGFKLGGMVNAQIISNGVTIRNDTLVTSVPS